MPSGVGTGLNIIPVVGNQTPADYGGSLAPVLFSYDPPTLLAIGRADRQPSQCLPIPSCYNGTSFCTFIPAQCYDAAGGYPVVSGGCDCQKDLIAAT